MPILNLCNGNLVLCLYLSQLGGASVVANMDRMSSIGAEKPSHKILHDLFCCIHDKNNKTDIKNNYVYFDLFIHFIHALGDT